MIIVSMNLLMMFYGNVGQISGSSPYTPLRRNMTLKMSASDYLDAIYILYYINLFL